MSEATKNKNIRKYKKVTFLQQAQLQDQVEQFKIPQQDSSFLEVTFSVILGAWASIDGIFFFTGAFIAFFTEIFFGATILRCIKK